MVKKIYKELIEDSYHLLGSDNEFYDSLIEEEKVVCVVYDDKNFRCTIVRNLNDLLICKGKSWLQGKQTLTAINKKHIIEIDFT